jgi:hypothetical protein
VNLRLSFVFVLVLSACSDQLTLPTSPDSAHERLSSATRRRAVTTPREIAPPCSQPAPLAHSEAPASPIYIFIFSDGVDADRLIDELALKYQFTPQYRFVGPPFQGFSALISQQTLASLRCEPAIARVEQAGGATLP